MPTRQIEICVETLQACEAASLGGADRIELCAALAEGGVTPSRGLLQMALRASTIPVHVLIRPRTGDFVYSGGEYRAMCADVEDALALGAAGIVVGLLTADREVSEKNTAGLVQLADGRPVTFHRAFDHTNDLRRSLETLIDLGCDRILTSGGRPNVLEGFESLRALSNQAAGRLRLAAGGGVTLANAAQLLTIPGLDLHASLRSKPASLETSGKAAADPLWRPPSPGLSADVVQALSAIVHGTAP